MRQLDCLIISESKNTHVRERPNHLPANVWINALTKCMMTEMYLQFCHQGLHHMKELSRCIMSELLFVQLTLKGWKQFVKFLRLNHWPIER